MTAGHRVHNEESETRNNHQYAAVMQGIQSYPCKTKTSRKTDEERSLQQFLEPSRKPKVIYTDNSLSLAKPVKIFRGIIVRRPFTVQKQLELL